MGKNMKIEISSSLLLKTAIVPIKCNLKNALTIKASVFDGKNLSIYISYHSFKD